MTAPLQGVEDPSPLQGVEDPHPLLQGVEDPHPLVGIPDDAHPSLWGRLKADALSAWHRHTPPSAEGGFAGHGASASFDGPPSQIQKLWEGVKHLPEGIAQAAVTDPLDAFFTPVVGGRQSIGSRGGVVPATGRIGSSDPLRPGIDDRARGLPITPENTPGAIDEGRMREAAMNTTANVVLGGIAAPVEGAGAVANAARRVVAAGAGGTYYSPDDPLTGILLGLGIGETAHLAGKGLARVMKKSPGAPETPVTPNATETPAALPGEPAVASPTEPPAPVPQNVGTPPPGADIPSQPPADAPVGAVPTPPPATGGGVDAIAPEKPVPTWQKAPEPPPGSSPAPIGEPKAEPLVPSVQSLDESGNRFKDLTPLIQRVTKPDAVLLDQASNTAIPKFLDGNVRPLSDAEVIRVGAAVQQAQASLGDIAQKALATADPEALADLDRQWDQQMQHLNEVASTGSVGASELGRGMRALQLMMANATDPAFWINQARRQLKVLPGTDVAPEVRGHINQIIRDDLASQAQRAADDASISVRAPGEPNAGLTEHAPTSPQPKLSPEAQLKLARMLADAAPSTNVAVFKDVGLTNILNNPALRAVISVAHSIEGTINTLVVHPAAALAEAVNPLRLMRRQAMRRSVSGAFGAIPVYLQTLGAGFDTYTGFKAAREAQTGTTTMLQKLQAGGPAMWKTVTDRLPPESPVAAMNLSRLQRTLDAGNITTPTGNPVHYANSPVGRMLAGNSTIMAKVIQGMQAYSDLNHGTMQASYAPYHDAAVAAGLYRRSVARIATEHLTPGTPEYQARLTELTTTNPHVNDLGEAMHDGAQAVWQQNNLITAGISGAKSGIARVFGPTTGAAVDVGVHLGLPVVRVPSNILFQGGLMPMLAPIDVAQALFRNIADAEYRVPYERLIRNGMVGGALMLYGMQKAKRGEITDPDLGDVNQRNVNRQAGTPPGYGTAPGTDTWINLARMHSAGITVAMGAAIYNAYLAAAGATAVERFGKAGTQGLAAGLQTFAQQPIMSTTKQMTDLFSAAQGSKTLERVGAQIVGRYIPGGSAGAAVARGIDPLARDPKTFVDELKSRIVGLSQQVPEKLSPLGDTTPNPMPGPKGVANQLFNPYPAIHPRTDPLNLELRRLKVGFTGIMQGTNEPQSEFAKRRPIEDTMVRQVLRAVVSTHTYQSLPDPEKEAKLREYESSTRASVRSAFPSLTSSVNEYRKTHTKVETAKFQQRLVGVLGQAFSGD